MDINEAFEKWQRENPSKNYVSHGETFFYLEKDVKSAWKQSRIDFAKTIWDIMQEDIHRNDQMVKIWNILDTELKKGE